MKLPYLLILSIFITFIANAQSLPGLVTIAPVITINARLIGKDSVIIPYDDNYVIVQDACIKIIRHAHYNFKDRLFFGKFDDRKADDTSKIVAEGFFSKNGLKQGLFALHYPDGQLEALGSFDDDKYDGAWIFYYPNGKVKSKGSFKKGKYNGHWELYYEDGSPQLFFDAKGEECKISGAWSINGTKIVNEGNGNYRANNFPHWVGKLRNGAPDSTWTCNFTLDTNATVVEYFKNGKFIRGYAENGSFSRQYSDKSSVSLFPQLPALKINHSLYMDFTASCNGVANNNVDVMFFGKIYHTKSIPLTGSHVYQSHD